LSPQELKKALVAAGLEVYRTMGDEIVLADRVRDNLIMDSGVRVREGQVTLVLKVRRAHFPNESEQTLFEHIRKLAAAALSQGFVEKSTRVAPMSDPSDPTKTLDTFFEVVFAKDIGELAPTLEAARLAVDIAKIAEPNR
jgi:hypothetical protein